MSAIGDFFRGFIGGNNKQQQQNSVKPTPTATIPNTNIATPSLIQQQSLTNALQSAIRQSRTSLTDPSVMMLGRTDEESVPESWVELGAPASRNSVCSSMDAIYIGDVMQRSVLMNNPASRHSPKSSMNSPNVEMVEGSDAVRYRLAKDMLPPGKNTDWLWDWSSRPEAVPPKEYNRLFSSRHVSGNAQSSKDLQAGIATALTTPPNSPIPTPDNCYGYSWRHTSLVRGDMLNADVVLGLIVSNLVTFLLGACIGYCVCLRVKEQKALE